MTLTQEERPRPETEGDSTTSASTTRSLHRRNDNLDIEPLRGQLQVARARGDETSERDICRRLDDRYVANAFRRLDDRDIRRLRRQAAA